MIPRLNPTPADRPEVAAHEWARAHAQIDMARATQQPWRWCEGLQALARCQREAGEADAADESLRHALRWAPLASSMDLWAELLAERGELALATLADPESPSSDADLQAWLRARSCAIDMAALSARCSDRTREAALLLRASDLFSRLGRPVDAGALQARALRCQSLSAPPTPD